MCLRPLARGAAGRTLGADVLGPTGAAERHAMHGMPNRHAARSASWHSKVPPDPPAGYLAPVLPSLHPVNLGRRLDPVSHRPRRSAPRLRAQRGRPPPLLPRADGRICAQRSLRERRVGLRRDNPPRGPRAFTTCEGDRTVVRGAPAASAPRPLRGSPARRSIARPCAGAPRGAAGSRTLWPMSTMRARSRNRGANVATSTLQLVSTGARPYGKCLSVGWSPSWWSRRRRTSRGPRVRHAGIGPRNVR